MSSAHLSDISIVLVCLYPDAADPAVDDVAPRAVYLITFSASAHTACKDCKDKGGYKYVYMLEKSRYQYVR